jgi:hypothetical protein
MSKDEPAQDLARRMAQIEIHLQVLADTIQGQGGHIAALTEACRALLATHPDPHLAAAFLDMGLAQAEADAVSSALSDRRVEAVQEHLAILRQALAVGMEAADEARDTPPPP